METDSLKKDYPQNQFRNLINKKYKFMKGALTFDVVKPTFGY